MNPSTPIAPKEGQQTAEAFCELLTAFKNRCYEAGEAGCYVDGDIRGQVAYSLSYQKAQNAEQKVINTHARLLARCAELEKLLAPFAALDVRHMIYLKKAGDHPVFGLNSTQFTLEDVTRAKAALALKPEGKQP